MRDFCHLCIFAFTIIDPLPRWRPLHFRRRDYVPDPQTIPGTQFMCSCRYGSVAEVVLQMLAEQPEKGGGTNAQSNPMQLGLEGKAVIALGPQFDPLCLLIVSQPVV